MFPRVSWTFRLNVVVRKIQAKKSQADTAPGNEAFYYRYLNFVFFNWL